jgi:hypothetical protein
MTKKQELLEFVIGNEFITKPSLQDKFKNLFEEAVNEQFFLHIVGQRSELLSDEKCDKFNKEVKQIKNDLGSSGNW